MANTTFFNWPTPDDTALVKDGASAIRTLGSAIDTSLVDLKGGTTGQVLTKATGTDMDFTWVKKSNFIGVSCTSSGNQSITTSTLTAVTLATEQFDTDAFHSTSTNTSRITIPSGLAGKYRFNAYVSFEGGALSTGYRSVSFKKNNTDSYGAATGDAFNGPTDLASTIILDLVATDYVEIIVWHNQGSDVNVQGRLQAEFLGA
jgi:hypothetical protein